MISQFKRTFQTIYFDEICCFLYVYVYMLFIQKTYMVVVIHETKQIEKSTGLLIISLLILSNPHLYERTGN